MAYGGLTSIIDSYYVAVANQMQAIGATVEVNGQTIPQALFGPLDARDWPQTPPIEGTAYLLIVGANPIGGTEAQTLYDFTCQWTWLLIGTDISAGVVGPNRGDRSRANRQIMSNLRQANTPRWTQKLSYAVNPQTGALTGVPVQSIVPMSMQEMVWWTPLQFRIQPDNQRSGLLYSTASLRICGYDDALPAVL